MPCSAPLCQLVNRRGLGRWASVRTRKAHPARLKRGRSDSRQFRPGSPAIGAHGRALPGPAGRTCLHLGLPAARLRSSSACLPGRPDNVAGGFGYVPDRRADPRRPLFCRRPPGGSSPRWAGPQRPASTARHCPGHCLGRAVRRTRRSPLGARAVSGRLSQGGAPCVFPPWAARSRRARSHFRIHRGS